MSIIQKRLANAFKILKTVERRREEQNDPWIGSNIERLVIARELDELEREWQSNPASHQTRTQVKVRVRR